MDYFSAMYESINSAHNVSLLIFIRDTDENLAIKRRSSWAVFCVRERHWSV